MYSDVLGNGVVLENLDGFPHPTGMPPLDVGDELGITPQDDMILVVRVLDDARPVVVTPTAMGFVFAESGGEVPTSLTNVHFAACTGDLVHSRSGIRILPVLVGLGEVADLVRCRVKDLDVVLGEGPLDLVRGAAQVREGY